MTFEQLRYIMAVQRHGTISAAAENLHVSAPAVSKAISLFEEEIGYPVFYRTNSGTQVLPEGEKVIELAENILALVDDILDLGPKKTKQKLKIGVYPQDIARLLSPVLTVCQKQFPNIEFTIRHKSLSLLISDLQERVIDIGLVTLLSTLQHNLPPEIKAETLLSCRLCVILSEESPLAQRPFVTTQDLVKMELIAHDDPMINQVIMDIFQPSLFMNHVIYTNDQLLTLEMVESGKFFGIHTEVSKQFLFAKQGGLAFVPLKHQDEYLQMDYVYCRNVKNKPNQLHRYFVEELKKSFLVLQRSLSVWKT